MAALHEVRPAYGGGFSSANPQHHRLAGPDQKSFIPSTRQSRYRFPKKSIILVLSRTIAYPCSNENTFNCSPAGPMQDSTNRSQQTTPGVDGAVRAASLDESHGRSKPASTHHLVIEGERGWLTCHRRRRTLSVFETARRALLRGAEYLARSRSGSHTHAGKGVPSGRHQDTLGQARTRASARGGRLLGQRQRRPGTCLLHPRCGWSVSPA